MSENNQGNGMGLIVAAVVGAAVGAGVALLFAPCSGKETREWVAKKTGELKDRAAAEFEHAKGAVLAATQNVGRDAEEIAEAHDRQAYRESAGTTLRG